MKSEGLSLPKLRVQEQELHIKVVQFPTVSGKHELHNGDVFML